MKHTGPKHTDHTAFCSSKASVLKPTSPKDFSRSASPPASLQGSQGLPQARGRCSGAAPHHSTEVSPHRGGSFAPAAPRLPTTPSLTVPAQHQTIPRQPNGKGQDGAAIAMQENSGPVVSRFLPLLAGRLFRFSPWAQKKKKQPGRPRAGASAGGL